MQQSHKNKKEGEGDGEGEKESVLSLPSCVLTFVRKVKADSVTTTGAKKTLAWQEKSLHNSINKLLVRACDFSFNQTVQNFRNAPK